MHIRELVLSYKAIPGATWDGRKPIKRPYELAQLLGPLLQDEPSEVFLILCLNTRHLPLCIHEVARGSLDSSIVHPREVYKAALLANAAVIALAHNHPSGDPTPSPDDVAITNRLVKAGEILGINVLDHLIVGHGSRFYSFLNAGQLPRSTP